MSTLRTRVIGTSRSAKGGHFVEDFGIEYQPDHSKAHDHPKDREHVERHQRPQHTQVSIRGRSRMFWPSTQAS
jgi:hypothetical protein